MYNLILNKKCNKSCHDCLRIYAFTCERETRERVRLERYTDSHAVTVYVYACTNPGIVQNPSNSTIKLYDTDKA